MNSIPLITHLPRLLLPQHLASITSLELLWDIILIGPYSPGHIEPGSNWQIYSSLIATTSSAFPSLSRLYISLQKGTYMAKATPKSIQSRERMLLEPIDCMVRGFQPGLRDCRIALPLSFHGDLMDRADITDATSDLGGPVAEVRAQYWRDCSPSTEQLSSERCGYWVCRGLDDTPNYRVRTVRT